MVLKESLYCQSSLGLCQFR